MSFLQFGVLCSAVLIAAPIVVFGISCFVKRHRTLRHENTVRDEVARELSGSHTHIVTKNPVSNQLVRGALQEVTRITIGMNSWDDMKDTLQRAAQQEDERAAARQIVQPKPQPCGILDEIVAPRLLEV